MADSRKLTAEYEADTSDFKRGTRQVGTEAEKAGRAASTGVQKGAKSSGGGLRGVGLGMGTALVAGFTVAVAGVGKAVADASNLDEVRNKTRQVFGANGAKDIEKYASTAAKSMGQSQRAALESASTFATFGKAAGLQGKPLGKFSTDLTTLSSDMASFSNTSPEEAATALGAALRGESEPIRKYGVLLDDATLRSRAMAMGLIKTTKEGLTPQQKALAAQAEIMAQTKDAQGDFARTSGGLANQQRILAANMEDTGASIGTVFLPVINQVVKWFNDYLMPAFTAFATQVGPQISGFINTVLVPTIQRIAGEFQAWFRQPEMQEFIRNIQTVVLPALAAFGGFLITQVIPAIFALIRMTISLSANIWNMAANIRNAALNFWNAGLKPVLTAVYTFFTSTIPSAANALWARVVGAFSGMRAGVLNVWNYVRASILIPIRNFFTVTIPAAARALWTRVVAAFSGMRAGVLNVWNWVRANILNPIRTYFTVTVPTAAGILWTRVARSWSGLKTSVSTVYNWIRDNVFRPIGTFFTVTIPGWANSLWTKVSGAFAGMYRSLSTAATNITTVITEMWNSISEAAKVPIRFVIQTVLEGGILKAFRDIAGLVGLNALAAKMHVSVPAGFYEGGATPRVGARRVAGVVHGNEHVVPDREIRRTPGGQSTWYRIRALVANGGLAGLPGYFLGGGVNPTGSGWNRHSGYGWARYAGDSTGARMGTPVRAYKAGRVTDVQRWNTSYGHHVRMQHAAERTLYAHLSSIAVRVGQSLGAGAILGRLGSTGNSTGPHTHFELMGGGGKLTDPGTEGSQRGVLQSAADYVASFVSGIMSKLGDAFAGPLGRVREITSTPLGQIAGAMPKMLADGMTTFIKGKATTHAEDAGAPPPPAGALAPVSGRGSIPSGMIRGAQIGGLHLAKKFGINPGTYGGHDVSRAHSLDFMIPGWLSPKGRARGNALADYAARNWRKLHIDYIQWAGKIFNPPGGARGSRESGYIPHSRWRSTPDHFNHMHATFFDNGGWLKPGLTLARNDTGRPERVIGPDDPIVVEVFFNDARLVDLVDVRIKDSTTRAAKAVARKRVLAV